MQLLTLLRIVSIRRPTQTHNLTLCEVCRSPPTLRCNLTLCEVCRSIPDSRMQFNPLPGVPIASGSKVCQFLPWLWVQHSGLNNTSSTRTNCAVDINISGLINISMNHWSYLLHNIRPQSSPYHITSQALRNLSFTHPLSLQVWTFRINIHHGVMFLSRNFSELLDYNISLY